MVSVNTRVVGRGFDSGLRGSWCGLYTGKQSGRKKRKRRTRGVVRYGAEQVGVKRHRQAG